MVMDYLRKNKMQILTIVLAIVLPFIISTIYLAIIRQNIFSIKPCWNDESLYYNQIKSVLEYGHPLGYFGYGGSHARFLNFGAHLRI